MQNRLLFRTLLLFLVTTCLALALQKNVGSTHQNNKEHEDSFAQTSLIREKRQRTTPRPGFFKTLFSVAFEQWKDTKDTFNKVNTMLNDNFLPENAPVTTTTESSDPNATTTKEPYKITRSELNKILQRNLKGLVRLFNIELEDALQQSKKTDVEFRKNASIEVSKFL